MHETLRRRLLSALSIVLVAALVGCGGGGGGKKKKDTTPPTLSVSEITVSGVIDEPAEATWSTLLDADPDPTRFSFSVHLGGPGEPADPGVPGTTTAIEGDFVLSDEAGNERRAAMEIEIGP